LFDGVMESLAWPRPEQEQREKNDGALADMSRAA
jgi:hypothetical protein